MITYTTENITSMPCFTNAGSQFNNIGWQMFVMKDGSVIDVLFQNDEFVNSHCDTVKAIEEFYDKKFIPGK